ncbi:hypothetical protein CRYUN_Cryun20dG0084500 [Craigia yunnanensis]
MTEVLEKMWSKFSLIEEEQTDVVIENEWVEDSLEKSKKCHLGKIVMRKPVNLETMKNVFTKL